MKAIGEGGAKPIASNENTSTAVRMSQEAIKLDSGGAAILDADYVCRSMDDRKGELSCFTKFEELPGSIVEGDSGNNGKVMKIKMANPSVHIEDYDGPIHILKSFCGDGKRFSINLRFDINSPSDLDKFLDYFTELTDKVGTVNMPFVKNKYRANLEVEFSKAVIVKEE